MHDWSGLIKKIEQRKEQLRVSEENLARISGIGTRTFNRFFADDDVKLSTIEKVTNRLGLDFADNEVISLKKLQKQRAKEKARLLASLVQGTSALEMQGLEEEFLQKIVYQFERELLSGKYKEGL